MQNKKDGSKLCHNPENAYCDPKVFEICVYVVVCIKVRNEVQCYQISISIDVFLLIVNLH